MNCPELEQLERFVSARLGAADRDALNIHLSHCSSCRMRLAEVNENLAVGRRVALQSPVETVASPDSSTSASQQTIKFPGYDLIREISRGGQGVVYQAVQKSTHRKVAIKVMREGHFADARERVRFEREVQILGQLRHPNIVTIYDSGSVGTHLFFVMDYISGLPLDAYVSEHRLSIDDILRLFSKVCDSVQDAHLRGIIHRDLKPGNIRVDTNGEPHVLDFGLAKVAGAAAALDSPVMTVTGQFLGSLPWSSPEQAEGQSNKIDLRTDVYSLGAILYQLLTGRLPIEVAGGMRDALDRILHDEPPRPRAIRPQLSGEVETIVLKCLSKDRDRRYQSAGAISCDIQLYLSGEPIEAKRDSTWYVLRKTLGRHKASVAAAVLVALSLIGGIIATAYQARVANRERLVADRERRAADATIEMIVGLFRASDAELDDRPRRPRDSNRTVAQVLQRGRESVAGLKGQPIIQAKLENTLGLVHTEMLDFRTALPLLREAFEIRMSELGEDNADTISSMVSLGNALIELDRATEAEPLLRRAAALSDRAGGVDPQTRLGAKQNLARALRMLGRLDEAAPLFREALRGYEREFGAKDVRTMRAMSNFGMFLRQQGKLDEAGSILTETVRLRSEVVGPEDPQTLVSRVNLAEVLDHLGRRDEATSMYHELYETSRRVLGDQDRTSVNIANNYAFCLMRSGRLTEAEPIMRRVVESANEVAGFPPLSRAMFGGTLGECLTKLGRCEQAEQLLLAAYAAASKRFAADHKLVQKSLRRLVEFYEKCGDAAAAAPYRKLLTSEGPPEELD